jgi:hypothetical protein
VKKILFSSIVFLMVVLAAGCKGGASGSGEVKKYDLDGREISFSIPPAPWKEEVLAEEAPGVKQGDELGDPERPRQIPVGVAFVRPKEQGKGSFWFVVMNLDVY